MPQGRYERYGLTGNPFRELSSDAQENLELYHVNLAIDQELRSIKEEALDKENRAVIALSGVNGAGKTERLRMAQLEASEREATAVYLSMGAKPDPPLEALAKEILAKIQLKGFMQALSPPKWYRELSNLAHSKKGKVPEGSGYGSAVAEALNFRAPAFLLINDIHHLEKHPELDLFLTSLQEVADAIKPGVLVMFGSYPKFLADTLKARPALASRVNRVMALPGMATDEAALMLAKKLLAKRLVEQLDPLYPFDDQAVAVIVQEAAGNPRRVLQLADRAMEYAVERRAYRVDIELARAAITSKTTTQTQKPAASGVPSSPKPTSSEARSPPAAKPAPPATTKLPDPVKKKVDAPPMRGWLSSKTSADPAADSSETQP